MKAIKEFIPVFCEPFHMPNLYLFKEIAEKASMEKIKVMYDGQDGDNVISHGFERFFEFSGEELMQKMSNNARIVCDGLGAARVLDQLEKLYEN